MENTTKSIILFILMVILQQIMFAQETPIKKNYSVTSNLNVRIGRGTNYDIIGKLKKGETCFVYEITNGWAKIKLKGKDGYVSSKFLTIKDVKTSQKTGEPNLINYLFLMLYFIGCFICLIMIIVVSFCRKKTLLIILLVIAAAFGSIYFFKPDFITDGLKYIELHPIIFWITIILIAFAIIAILKDGNDNECNSCKKWWAMEKQSTVCTDSESTWITKDYKIKNKNGEVIRTVEGTAPATRYYYTTYRICKYCKYEDEISFSKTYEN